ncbi:unnamed protein product [Bursaphelenchus xylophilus]|uniref:(pine wood nematode) hypothetical protein n=1 Tax=Bursaphelenchus xylophilus TaxID=6326 RepID=A0A1I7RNP9_BURXY|nr:unnamed protein product [Bursaphelenchus xylophilus]CAG9124210.1 unnamed protein product [Bursaphelenchus xylophilus]
MNDKKKTRRRKATEKTSDDDGTQMEGAEKKTKNKKKDKVVSRRRTVEEGTVEHGGDKFQEQLKEFVKHCLQVGVNGIIQEFAQIKVETAQPGPKTAYDANADKNRYKDVVCIDVSRVKLVADQDYIHANYMDFNGFERKYICTQGPTEKTVGDFWKMVVQAKAPAIVMLCGIMELGKKKCEQYWPEQQGSSGVFGDFTIKNTAVHIPEEGLALTTLEVSINEKEHLVVTHYFWQSWPDRGVPKNPMFCMRLIGKLNRYNTVVVHCSAGIGRTGTIVGLDYANRILHKGEQLRLKEVVKEMRRHRHNSVQTDVQYLFMHRVLMGIAENRHLVQASEIQPFMTAYDDFVKSKGG